MAFANWLRDGMKKLLNEGLEKGRLFSLTHVATAIAERKKTASISN
jgi:hypothetical protein